MKNEQKIYWIDLFAGAGGTTTGIHLAHPNIKVVACVNHDEKAIQSHKENHPNCIHFQEDVRDFEVVMKLKVLVQELRAKEPDCIINLWASLECTNYSKAKGGLPRDADSRTLANALEMYVEHLNPTYVYIENVREFMAWGPLDKNGKPIKMKNGTDYIKWIGSISNYGYEYDWKLLNSADFGAFTSRTRYFGIFAKKGYPISFPEPTHYDPRKLKKQTGMFDVVKKPWNAVREKLQLDKKGKSIFTRKKPLSENTLKRIYAGLIKFVAKGETDFIKKYYSGRPMGKVISLNTPAGTITTIDGQALVQTEFIKRYNGGNPQEKVKSTLLPLGTIATSNRHAVVTSEFLTEYYGNGKPQETTKPCPTITTKDRFALNYLVYDYSNFTAHGLEQPAGTITTVPKHNLVTNEWLTDTQYSRVGQDLDKPCFTLIARMDKKPPYLVETEQGKGLGIVVFDDDNETMIKIKQFMAVYGIVDIKMRMLLLQELKEIQGFPADYKLSGTVTDQKKQIGNAVVPAASKSLALANYNAIQIHLQKTA